MNHRQHTYPCFSYCQYAFNKLREAVVLLSQGNTIGIVGKKIGISISTLGTL